MRNFLFLLAMAIFLYSPYGPSWGRFAVNMTIIFTVGTFLMKNIPKRRYYDEEEEYN
ncbi:hypothetical protein [Hymenobacter roseosalivarius]|nr:hypothetical protein [Hymenobacter roseosalivarius]